MPATHKSFSRLPACSSVIYRYLARASACHEAPTLRSINSMATRCGTDGKARKKRRTTSDNRKDITPLQSESVRAPSPLLRHEMLNAQMLMLRWPWESLLAEVRSTHRADVPCQLAVR